MISDSEKNWVRHQHQQKREDALVLEGPSFMVMYITGATRRMRNRDCKGACISCLFLGHLGDPVLWHFPGSQSQVCSHLSMIRGWLDEASDCNMSRSLRTTRAMYASAATSLVSQVHSGVHCRICSGVRCQVYLGGHTRLQPGSSERVPMFRR